LATICPLFLFYCFFIKSLKPVPKISAQVSTLKKKGGAIRPALALN